ncbi:hypothetical protein Pmar_PMAR023406 [Perkinsus marinus ATCC 50983]|uniref:Uncharacterized protein n=1 Tax=Perkinsus marinus (strain ATCC 50983 / TXsc) TaxID=423536 RepID=C5KKG9_PERM5|nr:hypothetical protein Pmar_PMAR023406 [Perkinsus marinus ATCC 50983]EER15081.1 hypothetical protein Pmar_PMAR023406 [Perkinsus marinus ATCC 50983]|eukprot:XP_002783285.1 hypothetical protein Pmar_PMAR023406 [Perkinsus marinus ATCC 50983]
MSSGATGVQTMLVTNWDDYCRDKVGVASYCKTWDRFPVCQGSDVSCGDGEIATSTIPETTRAAGDKTTVPVTTTRSAAVPTTSGGTVNWDEYCQKEVGPTSYCKIWDASPVCQGSSVRCGNGAVVTTEHNFYPTTPHSGGDHEYCPGMPAGEYCGNINGEMALFLIEGDVFFFDYRYIHGVKVNLKEVPFHLYNCEEFVPDYSSWQMERLARELGLTTDQLRQKLTITYRRSSDSFHFYWEPNVSTSMYHDEC